MSHPEHQTFIVEVPVNDPAKMAKFNQMMSDVNNATIDYIGKLAQELQTDYETASNIWYLRGRSRWSQELEKRIIAAGKAGHDIVCNGDEEDKLAALGF